MKQFIETSYRITMPCDRMTKDVSTVILNKYCFNYKTYIKPLIGIHFISQGLHYGLYAP